MHYAEGAVSGEAPKNVTSFPGSSGIRAGRAHAGQSPGHHAAALIKGISQVEGNPSSTKGHLSAEWRVSI